ncbi:MAG: TatD family hydrolase [Flavobacteriales bacterium]|nr:TatD family hydrolase [Flavobacteriales bacterium]
MPKKKQMIYTDTHSHLYDQAFDTDRGEVLQRALTYGVKKIILPNVDSTTIDDMIAMEEKYSSVCECLMGVHPTSLTDENVEKEMETVEKWLEKRPFAGIGEIGMDLYWDATYKDVQVKAFDTQLTWAEKYKYPVSIHSRNAMNETLEVLSSHCVKGVMHCFSGTLDDAEKILSMGLFLGVGGTVTYKNNTLKDVIRSVGYQNIVFETDAPYLSPVPHRGKRNESSYIPDIAAFVAQYCGVDMEKLCFAVQKNAESIFSL